MPGNKREEGSSQKLYLPLGCSCSYLKPFALYEDGAGSTLQVQAIEGRGNWSGRCTEHAWDSRLEGCRLGFPSQKQKQKGQSYTFGL